MRFRDSLRRQPDSGIRSAMLDGLDITPEDPAELRAVNRLLADEVKALSLKVEQLQHQLHGHNRHRFGSKLGEARISSI